MRSPLAALVVCVIGFPALACSVCGVSVLGKNTLREELLQAKAAVAGTLKNPKPDPSGVGGSTEFHFGKSIKSAEMLKGKSGVTIPQYFPVIGDTPPEYLFFFDEVNDSPTVTGGVPATPSVLEYVVAAGKLDSKDVSARLAFYFKHLDSRDPTVAADAFLEFAKTPDPDILKAKDRFDPATLVKLLIDPNTPADRLGVFAALLGLCGEARHAEVFAHLLKEPLSERIASNIGGILAGYVLLEPKGGWAVTRRVLTDDRRPFEQRFSALGTVRFVQATRQSEAKADVLTTCGDLLANPDFADLVIEDLRRWGWWEKTPEVLAAWTTSAGEVREVKKAIIRYAITCPEEEAKAFVTAVRKSDAKLVGQVERSLELHK